jgi:hypothetical protein
MKTFVSSALGTSVRLIGLPLSPAAFLLPQLDDERCPDVRLGSGLKKKSKKKEREI